MADTLKETYLKSLIRKALSTQYGTDEKTKKINAALDAQLPKLLAGSASYSGVKDSMGYILPTYILHFIQKFTEALPKKGALSLKDLTKEDMMAGYEELNKNIYKHYNQIVEAYKNIAKQYNLPVIILPSDVKRSVAEVEIEKKLPEEIQKLTPAYVNFLNGIWNAKQKANKYFNYTGDVYGALQKYITESQQSYDEFIKKIEETAVSYKSSSSESSDKGGGGKSSSSNSSGKGGGGEVSNSGSF